MDLTKYSFRSGGKSREFFSLLPRQQLSEPEALMAMLLSRSAVDPETLSINEVEAAKFLDIVSENELTGFVVESIYLLRLEQKFRSIIVNHHGDRVDLLTLLTRQSGLEAIKFEKFQKKFASFLDLIAELNSQIIWFKGIVTSRTCYSSPEYRLSGDFDCFVEPKYFPRFFKILVANDFRVITGDTGFCNQLGVGPVDSINSLFLTPDGEYVPSAVCGMFRNRWPILDIKVNPLDRGLRMVELARFEANIQSVEWRNVRFSTPDLLDQLLITLTHFEKDRFIGWKQLLDIKLLAEKVNSTPELWNEFVRRCSVEGVSTACCAGLSLAQERLGLIGVESVIVSLTPKDETFLRKKLTFTVTPLFYWNTSSLPMLYANALLSDDSQRKKKVLSKSMCPDKQFLSRYYFKGQPLNAVTIVVAMFLHLLTLSLPGGVVRRTYGKFWWNQEQFGADR